MCLQWYIGLTCIDRYGKSFGIHTRHDSDHTSPRIGHKRITLGRPNKTHELFSSEVVGEVKVKITSDKELLPLGVSAPSGQGGTAYQHQVL